MRFRPGERDPAAKDGRGVYWKIGLTVRDLDYAVSGLKTLGVTTSTPHQFRDIGYLCHLTDPSGSPIELLQQGFEGRASEAGAGHPVGGQATLAHLTFRTRNIMESDELFIRRLGMRRISRQPVDDLDFELHFYSGVDDAPPDPALDARLVREWLWRRPYAVIEVQYLKGKREPLAGAEVSGFERFLLDNDRVVAAAELSRFA